MGSRGTSRVFKALAVLALLAMLVRAAAPAGYMLSASDRGGLEVVMCGGAVAHIDLASSEPADPAHPSDHGKSRTDHCLFAAGAALSAAPDQIAIAAPLHARAPADARPFSVHVGQGLAAPPPWSTGPPALV